ncbi:hypothetical protein GG344DRAFT_81533 [Lentinula edodes]|nr:hypothetical protein GG344DRAFT_81533 [Lentinula edodes]
MIDPQFDLNSKELLCSSLYTLNSNDIDATETATDTTAQPTIASQIDAVNIAPSTTDTIYPQFKVDNATKSTMDTMARPTFASWFNAANTVLSTTDMIDPQFDLNSKELLFSSLYTLNSNDIDATETATDTTAQPTIASQIDAANIAPSTTDTIYPQFKVDNATKSTMDTMARPTFASWFNAANTVLSTTDMIDPQFDLNSKELLFSSLYTLNSNDIDATETATDTTAQSTIASQIDAANITSSTANTIYPQFKVDNTSEMVMNTAEPTTLLTVGTGDTTNPRSNLNNTSDIHTTQSDIQSWVDAAYAALWAVEMTHSQSNLNNTTESAINATESTALSNDNANNSRKLTNATEPAKYTAQSIVHSPTHRNIPQINNLIASKTSITIHIYLASSWIEIPLLHSIFWNINVPSTWISVQEASFAISPTNLLEILQDYQTYIVPPSLLPQSIYFAACNPVSMLLTSSLVTIDSPLSSPQAQGRIIGKVGNVLNSAPALILGIDETNPLNQSFFNTSAKLNLPGNSTGKHFVLAFILPPRPSRSSPAPSRSQERWSPYGTRPISAQTLPALPQMFPASSESQLPFSSSQPGSPLSHPSVSAFPLQLPRPSSSHSSVSASFLPSPSSLSSSSVAGSLSPSPQSPLLPAPLQAPLFRPQLLPHTAASSSEPFMGIQNGDTFETNARDLADLCRGLGWDLKTLQYTTAATNADIVGLYHQYTTGRSFEQQIGSISRGDGDRRKRFVKYADNTVESVASILERLKFKKSTYDDKRRLFSFVEDVGKSNKIWNPANVPPGGFQKTFLRPYDVWVCIKYLWGPSGPLTLRKPIPEPSEDEDPVIEASRKLHQGCIRQYRIAIENSLVDPM